jgi:type I restriction enzyme R subunit
MAFLSEADIESALLSYFADLGYAVEREENIGPDGKRPERESYDMVILRGRLEKAIGRLNPGLPAEARADAIRTLTQCELPNLLEENRRIHKLLVEGVDVEYFGEDDVLTSGKVRIFDFDNPDANDWMVVNQFTVVAGRINRRPDVVVFVNGLPLAVVELKAPGDENATLSAAFNQLQTYKQQIPALFHTNAVLLTSDGMMARIGSLSADEERFMPWRTIDGLSVAPKGTPELSVLTEGVFERRRFLDLIRYCTVFLEKDGLIKILAGYHQFHAVRHAVDCTVKASLPQGDKRAGVIWHTQGSGKSLLMAFYAGRLVLHPAMQNPTLVVLTDRNDLDDQLFSTFSMCRDLIRQTPVQARRSPAAPQPRFRGRHFHYDSEVFPGKGRRIPRADIAAQCGRHCR